MASVKHFGPTRTWANLESCVWCYEQLANCAASVFPAPPPAQRSQEGPVECRPRTFSQPGAQRAERKKANAALAEGLEDGGEGAWDEGISFGIAYGFL
jgi:hypothetical protein